MKKYQAPMADLVEKPGSLENEQFAAMSDDQMKAYLREQGFGEKQKLYRANENYVLRKIAGEHVLIPTGDLPGNVMITINQSCAFIWEQLQEPKTLANLIAAAKEVFDDPLEVMADQICEFVRQQSYTGHIWEVR